MKKETNEQAYVLVERIQENLPVCWFKKMCLRICSIRVGSQDDTYVKKSHMERLAVTKIAKMSLKMLKIVFVFCAIEKSVDFSYFRMSVKTWLFQPRMWLIFLILLLFLQCCQVVSFQSGWNNQIFCWFQTMFWLISKNFTADFKQCLKQFFRWILI